MNDLKKKYYGKIEDMKKTFLNLFEEQENLIKSLATRGTWCATKGSWKKNSIITYDRLIFSDSNMDITGPPLNINTGITTVDSHKCYIFVTFQGSSLCQSLEPGG